MNDEGWFTTYEKGASQGGAQCRRETPGRPPEAAAVLSISQRALDYLVANKQLQVRRIGSRVLIPRSELLRFARADHPEPIAS